MAEDLSTATSWDLIVKDFISNQALTSDEQKALASTSPANVIKDLKSLAEQHAAKSRTRRYLSRLEPLLSGLESLSKALDVFVGADPHGVFFPLVGKSPCSHCGMTAVTPNAADKR